MTFIIESWFWRGTQSAIFYYISCAPCMDYTYKRKRRREAARAEKTRAEIVTKQPGIIPQPGPFQTNEAWGEEMAAGPGPPKGWKSDKLIQKIKQKMRTEGNPVGYTVDDVEPESHPESEQPSSGLTPQSTDRKDFGATATLPKVIQGAKSSQRHEGSPSDALATVSSSPESATKSRLPTDQDTDTPPSTPSTSPEPVKSRRNSTDSRPMGIRKMSSTYVAVKDTLRSSLHPERWNWKRYEREDEVLWGFERLNRIWDRATGNNPSGQTENQPAQTGGRKRAGTTESDRYDYNRARHPAINDLHPPVVSQLPSTREEAAWMLMAPPSRAVMEGKEKPNPEATMRWPLARIGTTREEEKIRRESLLTQSPEPVRTNCTRPSSKGKERASMADDPYVASDESHAGLDEGHKDEGHKDDDLEKENTPSSRASFPFPIQQRHVLARPAPTAHLFSEARKSWPDVVTALQMSGNGTHSPPQRWSYSGVWLA